METITRLWGGNHTRLRPGHYRAVNDIFQGGGGGGYLRAYRGLVTVLAESSEQGEELPDALKGYGPNPASAAFDFSESTKARSLLEGMAEAARQETRAELPEDLRAREQNLVNQLASIEAQWEKAYQGGEEAVGEVREKKDRLSGELRGLIEELRRSYPVYAALHYPLPVPAERLPLKADEVLLEYALGEKASYVFVVRQGGVKKVLRIALGVEALEGKVKSFMDPLINAQGAGFSIRQARELYDLLMAGALAEVKPTEQVLIVPDGILGLLPFEALVMTEGRGLEDSVYLGDRYTVRYYQSAAVLALQRSLEQEGPRRLLFALGNPVFSEGDSRYVAFKKGEQAPVLVAQNLEQFGYHALATRREWGPVTSEGEGSSRLVYTPLPETESEVRAIAELLGVEAKAPDVLLNVAASETGLRGSPLGEYRYIHLATHADLPGKVQGVKEPFVLLGQVENREGDDGLLTLSEVLGLDLTAEMVVLSACLTGRGEVMDGEGVVNFARAFQHAGARSVVVSLWEVASTPAVEYMRCFYGHLKSGESRSAALRLARQEMKSRYANPFYWAVFILHGEG